MHVRADERGHHRLAGKVDDPCIAGLRHDFGGGADGDDRSATDRDGLRHRIAAVDGDDRAVDQREIHARLRERRARDDERKGYRNTPRHDRAPSESTLPYATSWQSVA